MDEDRSETEKIRVVDKRRFSEAGEAISPDEPKKSDETNQSTAPSNDAQLGEESRSAAPRAEGVQGAEGAQSKPQISSRRREKVDFSSFVVSLATQSLVMMGDVPHPETGRHELNLDAARQSIDILAMLEEKTIGNLTPDEKSLISEIVASLRMAFVKKHNEQKKS